MVLSLSQKVNDLSSRMKVLPQPAMVDTGRSRHHISLAKGRDKSLSETKSSSHSNNLGFCGENLKGKAQSCRYENETTQVSAPTTCCKFKPLRVRILAFVEHNQP